jgi:hypothetical protein
MNVHELPTVLHQGAPADASLTPEQRLRQQAGLADLAFGSGEISATRLTSTQHLAFLPPEELALDLDDPQQRELGDYTLLEKLGQGGMGVVYRARQNSLDREVALKLLAAGPWASRDFIERFRREAQSAARMEHPNIVGIFEIGRHDELNFFSMRLVRGPSLAHRLADDGPMAPRAAAQLLRTVAEAVDYAHRLGVLHLDLKPGNVLIDESGVPLVADFGLARRMDESLGHESDEVSGTPSYMAPEQAQLKSHRLSAATDIYGLGAIAYELLSGRPPFLGVTPHETLLRVVMHEAAPLRSVRHDVPADLEAIVAKCLAKEPDKRYPSARALADDLSRFLDGRAVSVRSPRWPERLRRWALRDPKLAIAASAMLATLVVGVVTSSLQWRRAESNAAASRELLWEGRREAALRLERDGQGRAAMAQLLANIDEGERHGADEGAALDRLRLGLLEAGGVAPIDAMALDGANPFSLAISPDGRRLAIAFADLSLRWYDTATLAEQGRASLADRRTSDGQRRTPMLLRFVGNDRLRVTLEWYSNLAQPNEGDSWLVDLRDGAITDPPQAFAEFADATYSSDGRLAVLRNTNRQAQLWQVAPWKPLSALDEAEVDFLPMLVDPRGRFVLDLGLAMRQVTVRAVPSLEVQRRFSLGYDVGVSAWALSGDGDTLALGDFEGRLFLVDTRDWNVRALPATRGRELTWIAFSEDDAWVAAVGFDGMVQAFDARSGDVLVSGRMQAEFPPRRLDISRAQRLLVVAGAGQVAMWRLPLAGLRAVPARRIGLEPAPHGLAGPFATAWSFATGLLATAGMDGQVRLYRMPASPLLAATNARQRMEGPIPGAARLVDTEWNHVRTIGADGGDASPWRALAQPPGFATVLGGGRLVATIGPTLQVFDAATLAPLGAALPLPSTPQRMLASPDGMRVLLAFAVTEGQGLEERLLAFDVAAARALPGEARVAGPLAHLAWSADGARVLAVGPADGATTVLAADGLGTIARYEHDPFEPVKRAAFAADAAGVWMVTRAADPRFGGDALLHWNPVSADEPAATPLPKTRPLAVHATRAGVFVAGVDRDWWWAAGADAPHPVPRQSNDEPLAAVVASPDGQLVARAYRREVQLHDGRTGEAVGLPLPTGTQALDFIDQVGFADDGRQLRVRTHFNHWVAWSVAAQARPVGGLALQLERAGLEQEDQGALRMPGRDERAALRARDPGAWLEPQARPVVPVAGRASDGSPVPPRAAGTAPHLVPLDTAYSNGPDAVRNTFYSILPSIRPMPVGVQRFGGVDFDVRGMVQLGVVRGRGTIAAPHGVQPSLGWGQLDSRLECLPVAVGRVAAVHLLVLPSLRTPAVSGTPLAVVKLRYADGSEAQLPLRTGVELPGYRGEDQHVPQAFVTYTGFGMFGMDPTVLSTPRLANPHPGRDLRCIDVATVDYGAPLLLLGLTLEPPAPARPAVSPGQVGSPDPPPTPPGSPP